MTHPYDGCEECQEEQARLLAAPPKKSKAKTKAPTAEDLERHAARFGPEGVAETAEAYGLTVDLSEAKPPRRPRRRRT